MISRKPLFLLIAFAFLCGAIPSPAQKANVYLKRAAERVKADGIKDFASVCDEKNDPLAARILREYGAIFVTVKAVSTPPKCIFRDEEEVTHFQDSATFTESDVNGVAIRLQAAAMKALIESGADAEKAGLSVTPRGGKIAGTRSYEDTARLWRSRVDPGLDYWIGKKRITKEQAEGIRKLTPFEQVPQILEWEKDGIFFSTDKSRTILSSVAAPGTSQHLSGLACDVAEFADARVRKILNEHGWFQTIASDTPHFTFLGVSEEHLAKLGLKEEKRGGYTFHVPDL